MKIMLTSFFFGRKLCSGRTDHVPVQSLCTLVLLYVDKDRQVGFVCIDENLNRAEEVVADLLTASDKLYEMERAQ